MIKIKPDFFLVRVFIKLVLLFSMAGCALFDRHNESGYSEKDGKKTVTSDSGTSSKVTDSQSNSSANRFRGQKSSNPSLSTKLKSLENSISSKKELEQYSKVLPFMKSDKERVEFLEMKTFEDRQRWLQDKNFPSRSTEAHEEMRDLIDSQDIALGMPQNLVKKSWGEPDGVEVSGNPQFRNERWRYQRYVSTPDGYKIEKKIVYFEGGKVVGWEVE